MLTNLTASDTKTTEQTVSGSWSSHLWSTLTLGLPLVLAQLAQTMLSVTNTLVIGRLGAVELGASLIGWQLFYILWMFGAGFGFAVMPLAANAIGSASSDGGRRYVQMGLCLSLAYAVAMMIPLWNAEKIFILLGQDPSVASIAGDYTRLLQWSLFPQLIIVVLRSYLGALEKPGIVVWALLIGLGLNAILNIWFVHGGWIVPPLGISGSGLATFLSTSLIACLLIGYVHFHPKLQRHRIFHGLWLVSFKHLHDVFRLGWPIGMTVVAEVALFSASSFMMGWIGTTQLAAHGIAVQLSGLAFMIPLGLSAAVTVRVGLAYGKMNRIDVCRSVLSGYALGVLCAVITATIFLLIPQQLSALYLNLDSDATTEVLPIAVSFLAIAGVFQIVDAMQAIASGSLRGLKDTKIPMLIAIFSYWGIGVPVALLLAFGFDWEGRGIWWGLAIGLAASATLLSFRVRRQLKNCGLDQTIT